MTTEQEQLWLNHIDAAQQCWSRLSRAELLESQGLPHRLSRLLQEHYDLSREQADHQINSFKQEHQHPSADLSIASNLAEPPEQPQ